MFLSKISIKKILIWGLLIRLLALILVLTCSEYLSDGFLSSDIINDDVRYIAGGNNYAKIANSIIDTQAFKSAFYDLDNIYLAKDIQIWYWYVCVGLYLFKSDIILRVFNILFAIISIKCIYDVAIKLYGKQVAALSSLLYAIVPYPVFFCCFLYKDQLYTLVTLLLFRIAICYGQNLTKKHILYVAVLLVLSMLIRSGFAVVVAVIIFCIIKKEAGLKLMSVRTFIPILLGMIALISFAYSSMDMITLKLMAYVYNYKIAYSGLGSYFYIKTPLQIIKYPFSLLFITLLPVKISMSVLSWNDVVCVLNVMTFPIAFGNFLYFFMIKYKKDFFWWCVQVLYLITIVTSIEIFRHSYYLVPFTVIFFSVFYVKCKSKGIYLFLCFIPVIIYYLIFIYSHLNSQ